MSDASKPQTKEEVMSLISAEWAALMNTVGRLSAEQMLRPDEGGWTPKDNLAHLSEWMKILMGWHMDYRPPQEVIGLGPEILEGWDFDVINRHLLERNRGRSAEDVLSELRQIFAQLIERLESMSFEEMLKPCREDDPQKEPLLSWILGDSAEHFAEHRETIEKSM